MSTASNEDILKLISDLGKRVEELEEENKNLRTASITIVPESMAPGSKMPRPTVARHNQLMSLQNLLKEKHPQIIASEPDLVEE